LQKRRSVYIFYLKIGGLRHGLIAKEDYVSQTSPHPALKALDEEMFMIHRVYASSSKLLQYEKTA